MTNQTNQQWGIFMYTIWFYLPTDNSKILSVNVPTENGSLEFAQLVWDTLNVNFVMRSSRP